MKPEEPETKLWTKKSSLYVPFSIWLLYTSWKMGYILPSCQTSWQILLTSVWPEGNIWDLVQIKTNDILVDLTGLTTLYAMEGQISKASTRGEKSNQGNRLMQCLVKN